MGYSIDKGYTPYRRVSYLRTPGQKMRLLHRATDVSIRKYAENYRKFTEIYKRIRKTQRISVGQISYSSIGGVSLFNGIAVCPSSSMHMVWLACKTTVHIIQAGLSTTCSLAPSHALPSFSSLAVQKCSYKRRKAGRGLATRLESMIKGRILQNKISRNSFSNGSTCLPGARTWAGCSEEILSPQLAWTADSHNAAC